MMGQDSRVYNPQVKICGLTDIREAVACEELGVDAIGFVFYPKSPRNLTEEQAREICRALGSDVRKVGVFVNESYDDIIRKIEYCGLTAVQLHGRETPELVEKLKAIKVTVIKALFLESQPSFKNAKDYHPSAFLVEWGDGKLPGGNAFIWDWSKTATLERSCPVVLAGGLTPDNIGLAVSEAKPDAVDVSSGVEFEPGRKDLEKVKLFLSTVSRNGINRKTKKVF